MFWQLGLRGVSLLRVGGVIPPFLPQSSSHVDSMKEKLSGWSCNTNAGHWPGRYRSVSLWQKQWCPDSVSFNTGFPPSAARSQLGYTGFLLTYTLSFCHPKSHFLSCTFVTFWITFVLFLFTHNCQVLLSRNVEMRNKKSEVLKITEEHSEAPLPSFYFLSFVCINRRMKQKLCYRSETDHAW